MKTLLFLAFAGNAFTIDSALPEPFEKGRYEQTRSNSPFVLATKPVQESIAPQTKFTENMYVAGLGRVEGQEYVAIVRRGEEQAPIRLWGNSPNKDGISVHQIEWSDAFGKSKVKLAKAGLVEEIGFNENAAKAPAPSVTNRAIKLPVGTGVTTTPHAGRIRSLNQ